MIRLSGTARSAHSTTCPNLGITLNIPTPNPETELLFQAAEGEASGIRVYSIRPGAVETPMLRGLFPDFPADQCVQPEEVARFILRCVHEPEQVETGKPHHVTNQADHS